MNGRMDLDHVSCRRARLARDARFDGRFFVGVRTTGIFCRPICPAVPPREAHVTYFPTAAAAAEAGFRACLRCRPECAPGTPAWSGVSTTIARALRLIGDGALEDDGVDQLADRLGVGARHLRRLFVEHLGAGPVAVAQTRRLLSAKRLIDDTDMPLTTVAHAAGYGSIRRFNAAFLSSYGRSPRELRETGRSRHRDTSRAGSQGPQAPYSFQLRYRPPFDWDAHLAFLAPRAIPGVEAIDGGAYRRTIEVGPNVGWVQVATGGPGALRVDIDFPDPSQLLRLVSGVRRMFDLDADPMAIEAHLASDPMLAPLVKKRPGLRVPGAWNGFELGVRAILGQQVSVAAATTLAGRMVARLGGSVVAPGEGVGAAGRLSSAGFPTRTFPSPEVVAAATVADIGVPATRAEAIRRFAEAVARGEIRFDGQMDGAAFRRSVRELPGIGDWTAEYMALRALGDPDAFPSGDLGLLRATGLKTPRQVLERSLAWQPWRAYAALHLWAAAVAVR